jgi:hypothetical protein
MSLERLSGVNPGKLGIFSGSLGAQPATVQRNVVGEIEKLGFGTLWCGESLAREAFAQASIFLRDLEPGGRERHRQYLGT